MSVKLLLNPDIAERNGFTTVLATQDLVIYVLVEGLQTRALEVDSFHDFRLQGRPNTDSDVGAQTRLIADMDRSDARREGVSNCANQHLRGNCREIRVPLNSSRRFRHSTTANLLRNSNRCSVLLIEQYCSILQQAFQEDGSSPREPSPCKHLVESCEPSSVSL